MLRMGIIAGYPLLCYKHSIRILISGFLHASKKSLNRWSKPSSPKKGTHSLFSYLLYSVFAASFGSSTMTSGNVTVIVVPMFSRENRSILP